MAARLRQRNVLPGFGITMGFTLVYLSLIVLIPLATIFLKTATMTLSQFWHTVSSPRVMAAYYLSFGASLLGGLVNAAFGLLIAWTLVRYRFVGKSVVDALVDLPFALPTRSPVSRSPRFTRRTDGSGAGSGRWACG